MNLYTKIQLKEFIKAELMRSTHLDVLRQYINEVSKKIKTDILDGAKNNLEFCFYTNYV